MNTLLFPHRFQKVGWAIFSASLLVGLYIIIKEYSVSYVMNNIAIVGIVVGGILSTCSREKIEDEMTHHLRLNSLLIALYINYALLIVLSLVVYDLDFLQVMVYNMFTILIIFMIVFRWKMWQMNKGAKNEQ